MRDDANIDWIMLASYLASELTPAQRNELDRWLAEDPSHGILMTSLKRMWDAVPPLQHHSGEAAELWATAVERLGLRDVTPPGQTAVLVPHPSRSGMAERWAQSLRHRDTTYQRWGTAAMMAVVAVLVSIGLFRHPRQMVSSILHTETRYATPLGQQAHITLPDGSLVTLDVASQLEIPADYSEGDRILHLQGEALFTVAHHDGVPFTVIAGGTTARVLGTTFVIRRYETDTMTTVAVQDGKVSVDGAVLTARKEVYVTRTGRSQIQPADDGAFAFATGVFTLDYMTLAEAIPELNRWYNADIQFGDPRLAKQGIRGRFLAGSRADLASLLAMTFDVRVVRDGRVLTLYPR